MHVPAQEIGVGGMLVEASNRLVEHNGGEPSRIDVAQQILTVPQMLVAVRGARGEPGKVVEGLMVRLEIDRVVFTRVNHASFVARRASAVDQSCVPTARIPGPSNPLGR